jgi:hypothetical protein
MDVRTITLELPENIYHSYKERAEQTHRSVEEEMLDVVSSAAPIQGLPSDWSAELMAMNSYTDELLLKLVKKRIPKEDNQNLRRLNYKQQKQGRISLTEEELQTLEELGNRYDKHILIRSQALFLLKERGYDLAKFLKTP